MALHKEYHKLPEGAKTHLNENQEIKMSISFNKDGINWATSQRIPIGYRVTVIPVERVSMGNGLVSERSTAFSGFADTLIECDRQSKKRLEQAIEILHERVDKYMQKFIQVETEVV